MSVCTYRGPAGWLDDPGVLRPDEAQTVQSSQVTIHLFLEAEPGPDFPTETHPELEHDGPS